MGDNKGKKYQNTGYNANDLTPEQRLMIMKKVMSGTMSNEEAYAIVLNESKTNQGPKAEDRLNVSEHRAWKQYQKKRRQAKEQVLFSDTIHKVNQHGKRQTRVLVLTDKAMYNLSESMQVKRRIDLKDIDRIISERKGTGFVVRIPKEYDYWFESKRRPSIVNHITRLCKVEVEVEEDGNLDQRVQTKQKKRSKSNLFSRSSFLSSRPSFLSRRSISRKNSFGSILYTASWMGRSRSSSVTSGSGSIFHGSKMNETDDEKLKERQSEWKARIVKSYKWTMYLAQHSYEGEVLGFADLITKINSRGRKQTRVVAITNKAMYNLTDKIEIQRRIKLEKITRVTRSIVNNEFIVHVPSEYDYWFDSPARQQILDALKAEQKALGVDFQVANSPLKSLKGLVQHKNSMDQKNSKGSAVIDTKINLPALPGLKEILTFVGLKDKRDKVRAEFVTTEQSYCRSLSQFLACFAHPLDVERNRNSIMQNRNKWIDIFDNFENIVRFHCDFFCPDLQKCVKHLAIVDPVEDTRTWATSSSTKATPRATPRATPISSPRNGSPVSSQKALMTISEEKAGLDTKESTAKIPSIGHTVMKRMNLLKTVYEPYLSNWTKLQEAIATLKKKGKYIKFLNNAQMQVGGMDINSYLIMPIQRVPRYVLLMNELVKRTDESHPHYNSLQKARVSIQKIAKVCDSYIK